MLLLSLVLDAHDAKAANATVHERAQLAAGGERVGLGEGLADHDLVRRVRVELAGNPGLIIVTGEYAIVHRLVGGFVRPDKRDTDSHLCQMTRGRAAHEARAHDDHVKVFRHTRSEPLLPSLRLWSPP